MIIVIVGGLLYFAFGPQGEAKLVLDWRLRLTIHDSSTASNNTIPAYIGVEGGMWNSHTLDAFGLPGYAPISTRDTTGTIYIQSTAARIYTFGDFFDIWGQTFNETCVLDYCADLDHPPPFMSDGEQERCLNRNTGLSNGKDWVIITGSTLAVGRCNPGNVG